ncbi:MAG: PorT family protein [Bacteroidaceae bacterium]|nr:PorT family protein [Bacteroidaceae bacterium]
MSTRLLLISLIFLFCTRAHVAAQVGEHRNDLAIGVNGGYLLNRVSFSPSIKQSWKGGETFGVTVRYTCEKYFSAFCAIQAEINYANTGWKELIETSTDTYRRDMRYMQMPIFARLAWGKEHRGLQLFVQAGPQLGYYLSSTEHRGGEWSERNLGLRPNLVVQQYDKEVETKFEYGIAGGLGVQMNTRIGQFSLEGRYFFALSDMFKNGKQDPFGRSANGTIYIKAGYTINVITTK